MPALREEEAERTGDEVLSGPRRDLRRVGVAVVRVQIGSGTDGTRFKREELDGAMRCRTIV